MAKTIQEKLIKKTSKIRRIYLCLSRKQGHPRSFY